MSVDRILALKLVTDVGNIDKQMAKASGRFGGMAREAKSWGKAFATGLAIDGIGAVVDKLGDAWEGFRSGERVAAQLGNTWSNLGLNASKLGETIDAVTASTLALGTSDDEAVAAFNESIKRTGDSAESMRRLQIAQDLVANGSAKDLASAFKIVDGAAKGSAKVVDKFGLTSDTAGGRVKELGDKVKGAAKKAASMDPVGVTFNAIDEALESIVGIFATGDVQAGLDGIALSGAAIGMAWAVALPNITAALDQLTGGKFTEATDLIAGLIGKVVELSPHFDNLAKLIGVALAPIGLVVDVMLVKPIEIANTIIGGLLDGIADWFRGMKEDIKKVTDAVGALVNDMVVAVVDALNSINNLSWGGGSFDLYNIPQDLANALGVPANGKVSWPGGDFQLWPDLGYPGSGGAEGGSHKAGLDYVPSDGYMAQLHQGEAVLNADAADAWRSGGGGDVYVTLNIPMQADAATVGMEYIRAIEAAERRHGKTWRTR